MENNNENKARFFAQYLGQTVEYPEIGSARKLRHKLVAVGYEYIHVNYKRKVKGCIGSELSFKDNKNHNSDALNAKLILKPLSQISDEDAIEVAKIMNLAHLSGHRLPHFIKGILKDYGQSKGKASVWIETNDFLRKKGYAIPFDGTSVEEMIEYGWIKLKSE